MLLSKTNRRRLTAATLFIVACLVGCRQQVTTNVSSDPDCISGTEIFKAAASATVIVKKFTNSIMSSWGTATCVAARTSEDSKQHFYIFITARHVVNTEIGLAFPLESSLPPDNIQLQIIHVLHDDTGRNIGALIVWQDENNLFIFKHAELIDLTILVVSTSIDLKIKPATILNRDEACGMLPGAHVWSMGSPICPLPSLRSGFISTFVPTNRKHDEIMLDIGIAPGCSGGGVYNDRGLLCGVVYGMFNSSMAVAIVIDEMYDLVKK